MTKTDGLSMVYLPVNQAHAVMWHDEVLRLFAEKQDAVEYLAYLRGIDLNSTPEEQAAYLAYQQACHDESLSAHDMLAWRVHGRPTGPV